MQEIIYEIFVSNDEMWNLFRLHTDVSARSSSHFIYKNISISYHEEFITTYF
jgi:hypothetical protein